MTEENFVMKEELQKKKMFGKTFDLKLIKTKGFTWTGKMLEELKKN